MKKRLSFMKRIHNRQFNTLFIKNWIIVFLCIVLPLLFSVFCVRYFSEKSLLDEVGTAVKRGTNNTAVTVNTLLEEAYSALEKQSVDESINSFFHMQYSKPVRYEFISAVRNVLSEINGDYRENLYESINIYSSTANYLISSPFSGQEYRRFEDKSLLQIFEESLERNPDQTWIAEPRITTPKYEGSSKRVITIYRVRTVDEGQKSFVSISLDVEKLIGYITDSLDSLNGAYLIVDEDNHVVFDTAGQMYDKVLDELNAIGGAVEEIDIDGEKMWAFGVTLDFFSWKLFQIVPMNEVQENNIKLNHFVFAVFLIGVLVATMLSYSVTVKLYYPIEAILQLLENPSEQFQIDDEKGEVQFLLISILELFQKNMTLEQEMVTRVAALRSARAKALQEQMTPHFLNNVLQTINWTAIMETGNDDSLTSRSLLLLADILRTGKEKTSNLTSVEEEISYTSKFVELERLRYGNSIQCHYDISPNAKKMPIPCISLQTLIENSIIHGLQPKNASGNIYITINAISNSGLFICVEDDGVGIQEQKISQIFDALEKEYIYVGEHVGIVNLFQRFRLIYGNDCKFSIENGKLGGACVKIELPELPEWWNEH